MRGTAPLLSSVVLALTAGCSSLAYDRDTPTSGTFVSTGWAFTLVSFDMPKGALEIARENASDPGIPNTEVTEATVTPYFGFFDFLLDIIGVRRAKITGTWGYESK